MAPAYTLIITVGLFVVVVDRLDDRPVLASSETGGMTRSAGISVELGFRVLLRRRFSFLRRFVLFRFCCFFFFPPVGGPVVVVVVDVVVLDSAILVVELDAEGAEVVVVRKSS